MHQSRNLATRPNRSKTNIGRTKALLEILANWFVSVWGLDGVGLTAITAIRVEVGTIFERSRRFRTEDLAMIEPGPIPGASNHLFV